MDELERQVHLEAMAIGYALFTLLIMVLGLLQRVVQLKFEDWSYLHVWAYLPIFYFGALAFVWRRYK